MKRIFLLILIAILSIALVACGEESEDSNKEAKADDSEKMEEKEVKEEKKEEKEDKKPKKEAKKKESTEDKIKKSAKKAYDKDQKLKVKFNKDSGIVLLDAKLSDNLTTNLIIDGALIDATDALEQLKGIDEIKMIQFDFKGTFADTYGEETEETAISFMIDKETLDKINFDNFDFSNLEEVAKDYYVHPGMN
ncbi:hypothetical protein CAI16_05530 [Virgibacillus dokdonensis]|uniref:Uncharacterized protein n=1 Tax=Virgibacillus dokdonensis TaxID=302167 RepID=A0A3E0WTE2_9BACI|nr:hypothetical protein [Virgibacillus dokdonensis]RFA36250.1 hypothetical protein CAI16_05530 [Virgibacillus dokdonensis]